MQFGERRRRRRAILFEFEFLSPVKFKGVLDYAIAANFIIIRPIIRFIRGSMH